MFIFHNIGTISVFLKFIISCLSVDARNFFATITVMTLVAAAAVTTTTTTTTTTSSRSSSTASTGTHRC